MSLGVWYIIFAIILAILVGLTSLGGTMSKIATYLEGVDAAIVGILGLWIFIRGGFTCKEW